LDYHFTNEQVLVAAFVLVLAAIIVIAACLEGRRTEDLGSGNRSDSESAQALLLPGSLGKAGANSLAVSSETLDLDGIEQERFAIEWSSVQSRFVENPRSAVTEADELVAVLFEALGYREAILEQCAVDLSFNHAHVIEDYRQARALSARLERIEATTEELRIAMVQYRVVFVGLVQAERPNQRRSAA
jgi:hypothetical protein